MCFSKTFSTRYFLVPTTSKIGCPYYCLSLSNLYGQTCNIYKPLKSPSNLVFRSLLAPRFPHFLHLISRVCWSISLLGQGCFCQKRKKQKQKQKISTRPKIIRISIDIWLLACPFLFFFFYSFLDNANRMTFGFWLCYKMALLPMSFIFNALRKVN